jgi:hypothetical protein
MALATYRSKIIEQLLEQGVIPRECSKWMLISEAGDAVRMVIEVFITEEQFQRVADAVRDNPGEARDIARTIVFRSRDRDSTASVEL